MAEDQQLPDWLLGLRGQQPPEQPRPAEEPQPAAESPTPDWLTELRGPQPGQQQEGPKQAAVLPLVDDLQAQTSQPDLLGDLREQIIQPEDLEPKKKREFLNLQPWQRFVLALLLFLNVALCGCMALVMVGRVALPF